MPVGRCCSGLLARFGDCPTLGLFESAIRCSLSSDRSDDAGNMPGWRHQSSRPFILGHITHHVGCLLDSAKSISIVYFACLRTGWGHIGAVLGNSVAGEQRPIVGVQGVMQPE